MDNWINNQVPALKLHLNARHIIEKKICRYFQVIVTLWH